MNTSYRRTTVNSRDPLINPRRELRIRGFSNKTIKSYLLYNTNFLKFVKKSPKSVNIEDIKEYLALLISSEKTICEIVKKKKES